MENQTAEELYQQSCASNNEENFTDAVRLLTEAAEAGSDNAMYDLSICYEEGKGVKRNVNWAAYWCIKAANEGHKRAMTDMANRYKDGLGVDKSDLRAEYWRRIASGDGDREAITIERGDLYKNYLIAALIRDKTALGALAECYSAWERITILDMIGLSETTGRKFLESYGIDIVILADEALENRDSGVTYELIRKAKENHDGLDMAFIILFCDKNAVQALTLGQTLQNMELFFLFAKENDGDIGHQELIRQVHNMIDHKEKHYLRMSEILQESIIEIRATLEDTINK